MSLAHHGMVRGLLLIERVGELCNSYLASKQQRALFPKMVKYHVEDLLDLVHGDLCEPIMLATHDGRHFFPLLIDDSSQYMWLKLLSSKDTAATAIQHFKVHIEGEIGKKLKVLWTNCGREFTSINFTQYCIEKDIGRHLTASYSPQQKWCG